MAMQLAFFKYQGTGNDFILLDNRKNRYDNLSEQQIAFLCDRHFGIGADGLIRLSPSQSSDFQMDYFNSDGKPSTMCGNGGRCLVAFAKKLGIEKEKYEFKAIDGLHQGWIEGSEVHLSMIDPKGFQKISEEEFWIDTGSPHYVRFLDSGFDLPALDVNAEGSHIRHSELFAEEGTNVNFVVIENDRELHARTYERGVEAETLSCGTGVVACAAVQAIRQKLEEAAIIVHTPGGKLQVNLRRKGNDIEEVRLVGPADYVFSGTVLL